MPTIETPREAIVKTLEERGWKKGGYGMTSPDGIGPVCMHGAIQVCDPVPGDAVIIEQVWECREHGTSWNDDKDTEFEDVISYVKSAPDITDEELEDVLGPQWLEIVNLVRAIAGISDASREKFNFSWNLAWSYARHAAQIAERRAEWDIEHQAALALSIRDLIGQRGFTQAHYDTLTGPWRRVVGKIHPDDEDM